MRDGQCVDRVVECQPPQVLRNGRCVNPQPVNCPAGQVLRNGQCVDRVVECRRGQVLRNGRCVDATPTCREGQVLRNGRCVDRVVECRAGQVLRNGRCVDVAPTCRQGQVLRDGRCVDRVAECRPPQVLRNGRCVDPDRQCRPGQVYRNGRCVDRVVECRPPRVLRNGRCILPDANFCRPPRVWRNGRCILPDRPRRCVLPYIYSSALNRCILPVPIPPLLPAPRCEAPWLYSASAGGCICPSGYVVLDGACVRRDTRICSAPFVYSISENRCVCQEGYRPYGAGCAPIRPRPTRQENVAWIQGCLNESGYDAGTVDGLPGPQTQRAWREFREDEGLGDETVPYTDPETLAMLFEACQPVSAEPGSPPPAGTAPPIAPPVDTAPEDEAGLPGLFEPSEILCATGRIFTLLAGAPDAPQGLEACGQSCIPAPEGMSEEELERQEAERGITWCRSCISVGDLGLVCPRLPEDQPEGEGEPAAQ
ncbi:hypothetical protein H2509_05395 [Stappia sp. F7233]|uniref:Peptidoglycan binding-like domain-containing protein n=1 Tax=Stappia albiluteola TaxID=2758565 RepID=A0A839ABK4_9HYPH|nr:peptidoglycan-binding domain-containing protein [Stappia albiluteola]MBA5776556.1 hypothetical protein [Stappia albiluteola]